MKERAGQADRTRARRLGDVAAARKSVEKAERAFRAAIIAAVGAGNSQAEVGRAAGFTRGRINQLVREASDE